MVSTALNKGMREDIARELLRSADRDKEIEEARKEQQRIADQIYMKAFTYPVVKQMYSLPDGWLPTTSTIRVAVGTGTNTYRLSNEKRVPMTVVYGFGDSSIINRDAPFARDDELTDAHEGQQQHIENLRAEYRKIKRDIWTVLEGCNTTKQLIAVWPEIEHVVRKYEKSRHVRALPAKPVADLNRELGLNQISGPSQSRHKRVIEHSSQPVLDNDTGNVVALPSSNSSSAA